MNNPNPFVPQGSLLEQEKRRSRMKLAVFCVLAVGVCGLTAMLIQGCKRENTEADNNPPVDTNAVATADTNLPPIGGSNMVAAVPTNPPVVVPPPVEPAASEYTVAAGDTLGKIAKAHGISLKALEAANPNVKPTRMKVGDKIMIPAGAGATVAQATGVTTSTDTGAEIYTVKSGDTLGKIAKAHGISLKTLEAANPGVDPNHIKVGKKLNIPAKVQSAAPAPAPVAPVISPAPVAPAPSATPAH